jgi:y4mF family transcriptional regulator
MLPNKLFEIGNTVIARRDTLKITQERLAAFSGVSLRTIRQVEQGNGNPSLATMVKIFEVLGLETVVQVKKKGE